MKKYFVDTNVILRFLLEDNKEYFNQARDLFIKAKKQEIKLHFIPEVFFEIDYVLRGVYSMTKNEVADLLNKISLIHYFNIVDRSILIQAIRKYKNTNIDFFDIFLHFKAQSEKAEVFSFDKDFQKLKN